MKPAPVWRDHSTMTNEEAAILERECTADSEFDALRSRQTFYTKYKNGYITPVIKSTENGKVIALLAAPAQQAAIPWNLWGRIFQGFARPDGRQYTVFLCPHPLQRQLPHKHGEPVGPLHINGGYTYPCDSTCVFIYRAEDATRVLIHELLHAACTDRKGVELEQMEAETEAWAELFWCAFMASGDLKSLRGLKALVRRQSAWMRGQGLALQHGDHFAKGGANATTMPFPWRYTLGKQEMWQRWGILDTRVKPIHTRSLRLTIPPPAAAYRKFEVPPHTPFL